MANAPAASSIFYDADNLVAARASGVKSACDPTKTANHRSNEPCRVASFIAGISYGNRRMNSRVDIQASTGKAWACGIFLPTEVSARRPVACRRGQNGIVGHER